MDVFGASDPYVELKLSGERLAVKKTSTKMRNLNPEWNEKFKLVVNDPETQFLELLVYDWDKVGKDDKLGMQFVPLKQLTAHDTQELTLDLLGNTNESHPRNQKPRGQLVVELTYNPFKYKSDSLSFVGVEDEFMTKQGCIDTELAESNEAMDKCMEKQSSTDRELAECKGSPVKNSVCTRSVNEFMRRQSCMDRISAERVSKAGLLLVTVMGAEDLEADHRINPYAEVSFRGEKKKTKAIKRNRNPIWNEEFTFMIEESPLNDKLHISVLNKRKTLHFSKKESLGYIDIPLADVMYNGRINEKYHLINSPIGVIKVDIQWQIT